MSKVQVLVTTMHQTDISKFHDMNLQTDAVIANQADSDGFEEMTENGSRIRFVTKSERGTSKNRNTAIDNAFPDCDYLMFSDDDLTFYEGYEDVVVKAFEQCPDAEAVKFNVNCISKRKISMKPIKTFHKATRREVTSFGLWAMAVKTSVLKKTALKFNEFFGPGTPNYCGEDSIFLQEMFKKGIKFYLSPEYIADIDQDVSSWFDGDLKHFSTVCGMLIDETYPWISFPLVFRSAFKSRRRNKNYSYLKILGWYLKGVFKNKGEHLSGKRKQT